jgi:hypothetical protein
MKEWADRSPEIAALLNPAFCGYLISVGLAEYTKNINEGAPYAFPFVMLPLVLHKPSRTLLPRSTRTAFSAWITNANTAIAKIGYAERAKNVVPYVREALVFAIQNGRVQINKAGQLRTLKPTPKSFPNATQEIDECVRAAMLCGKWFSKVGDFKTAMALLGVRP